MITRLEVLKALRGAEALYKQADAQREELVGLALRAGCDAREVRVAMDVGDRPRASIIPVTRDPACTS